MLSETDNGIGFEFHFQINHGPEWNVEFLIPIQTPRRHFCNFWVLKMGNFSMQNFSSKLAIDSQICISFLNISHIL